MAKENDSLGMVTLLNVRLGFPFLFQRGEPQKRDDGTMTEGNFRASGIMYTTPKYKAQTNTNLANLKKARLAVMAAKFGENQTKWPKIKPEKLCTRDGNLENWDGFQDSWYCSASEQTQPQLFSRVRDPKNPKLWLPATRELLYAGCMVSMIVQLWVQDNKHGQRVNANLKAVQFFAHNEHFAGSAPIDPTQAFTEIEEEDPGTIGGEFGTDDDDDDSVV